MVDMLQNAKDLIEKGKTLNDPELVQMGMDLLEQYSPQDNNTQPAKPPHADPEYRCSNCDYTMPVDKEGRKRCPECKKHKLEMKQPTLIDQTQKQEKHNFITTVRDNNKTRVNYDEDGNPIGTYTKSEPVNISKNQWSDDDLNFCNDKSNQLLKKFTQRVPRRNAIKFTQATCNNCGKQEKVHPSHIGGRSYYMCTKCVGKRSQF